MLAINVLGHCTHKETVKYLQVIHQSIIPYAGLTLSHSPLWDGGKGGGREGRRKEEMEAREGD